MNQVRKNQFIRLLYLLIPDARKRSAYLKKYHYFNEIGENVLFYTRKLPADAQYIRIHNNVVVASEVMIVNHDVIHTVFNNLINDETKKLNEFYDYIEIMDNVFIGTRSVILPGVKIGPNAIVAAGSVVTHDVPEGSIVGGNPAVVIGSFDKLMEKRLKLEIDSKSQKR